MAIYNSIKNIPKARPSTFPKQDLERFMSMSAYPYYETYARILQKKGKDKLALHFELLAIKNMDFGELLASSVDLYT